MARPGPPRGVSRWAVLLYAVTPHPAETHGDSFIVGISLVRVSRAKPHADSCERNGSLTPPAFNFCTSHQEDRRWTECFYQMNTNHEIAEIPGDIANTWTFRSPTHCERNGSLMPPAFNFCTSHHQAKSCTGSYCYLEYAGTVYTHDLVDGLNPC